MTAADHGQQHDADVREPQDPAAPVPGRPEESFAGGSPTADRAARSAETAPAEPGGSETAPAEAGGSAETAQSVEAAEAAEAAEASGTQMVADLAKAQEDVAGLTADLQRLQAEYVNYKRRVDRDRELVKQNAVFSVVSSLLPVLDDIDRARNAGELEGGFKAVADSLERTIAGLGLTKFGEPGDEFDPNLHEALMHAHSPEVTTTTCQEIVQAGYRIGDRVVRAARVTVVDPEPADDDQ